MKILFSKILLITSLLVIMLFLESCTVAKISGRGAVPLIMNQPQAKVNVIQNIEASKQSLFDYTGAVDISEVLKDVMVGQDIDAIININITIKSTVGDFFINLFTLGLANAKTYVVSGEAIKAPNGLSNLIDQDMKPIAVYKSLNEIQMPSNALSNKTIMVKDGNGYSLYSYPDNQ